MADQETRWMVGFTVCSPHMTRFGVTLPQKTERMLEDIHGDNFRVKEYRYKLGSRNSKPSLRISFQSAGDFTNELDNQHRPLICCHDGVRACFCSRSNSFVPLQTDDAVPRIQFTQYGQPTWYAR